MTTKILSGTYNSGYTLSASFTALSVTSTGVIAGVHGATSGAAGASGLTLTFAAPVNIAGHILGGYGHVGSNSANPFAGGPGGAGGAGVDLEAGGYISNSGDIFGYFGGSGGTGYGGGGGGSGGDGIDVVAAGTVVNTYSIAGGAGGGGGGGSHFGGRGGDGGAGVDAQGGGLVSNGGLILGGDAGSGGVAPANSYYGGPSGAGGDGVVLGAAGSVSNNGAIDGGFGGGGGYGYDGKDGGAGGAGVAMTAGDKLSNARGIHGGGGGAGAAGEVIGGAGGAGGVGAYLASGDSAGNSGTVTGGAGGAGGSSVNNGHLGNYGVYGGAGGTGGAALALASGAIVSNTGRLIGGYGGAGGQMTKDEEFTGPAGVGGVGGFGVDMMAAATLTNGGIVEGGQGGDSGYGGGGPGDQGGRSGAGGVGVEMAAGGRLINTGKISGGQYGSTRGYTGALYGLGGDGVDLMDGGSVTNGSTAVTSAVIFGRIGVQAGAGAATLTNFGTIVGTAGVAVGFYSVDRLISEAGAKFIGAVNGGGGTLEIGGGVESVAGLGAVGTLSGAMSATFSGFGDYTIDAAATLTFAGANAIGAGKKLIDHGQMDLTAGATLTLGAGALTQIEGQVSNAGAISVAGAGVATSLTILAAGATLSGGGTVDLGGTAARILGLTSAAVLTNAGDTLSGVGSIGLERLTLINEAGGVIDASVTGDLKVDTMGKVLTNAGLMEAAGGTLLIVATTVKNTGGTISAGPVSHVNLEGDDIEGGVVTGASSGVVDITTANDTFDGAADAMTLSGVVHVLNGATLTMRGAVTNTGKLETLGGSGVSSLIIGAGGLTLAGAGEVILNDSANNRVAGLAASDVLTNAGNVIEGAGSLGGASLTLINQAAGVIKGDQTVGLIINTGTRTITNAGTIENTGAGGTVIKSAVDNTGTLEALTKGTLTLDGAVTGAGTVRIGGGTADFASTFTENVTFTSTGGTLELAKSAAYTGKITGFAKTNVTSLDLLDIAFGSKTKATFSGTAASGVLTVTDGTHTAHITLVGNYTASAFTVATDEHGGTKVVDPPAAAFASAMAAFEPGAGSAATAAPPRTAPPLVLAHG